MDPPPPSLIASFTNSPENRECGREGCTQEYAKCTNAEKLWWKLISNSQNSPNDSQRWFCPRCMKYYRDKESTRTRDDIIEVSTDNMEDIRKNVARAQKGKGHRMRVNAVGPAALPAASTARPKAPNITPRGHTYDSSPRAQAEASGYTQNHAKYLDEHERWARKAAGHVSERQTRNASLGRPATPEVAKHEVAIKVHMGVVISGQKSIKPVAGCVEGLDGIDAHIGGDDLHRRCYDVLQSRWLAWSRGYHIRLEDTTLRYTRGHTAIAGKGLMGPAKQRDAIWNFFYKARGNSTKRTFKAEPIMDMAMVLGYDDFANAEAHRNKEDGDASMPTMSTSAKARTTNDPSLFEDIEIISDNEDFGSMDTTEVGTKRNTSTRPTTPDDFHRRLGATVRNVGPGFVSPDKEAFSSALSAQQNVPGPGELISWFLDGPIACRFYDLPVASYIAGDLPTEHFSLDDDGIDVYMGKLEVDFKGGLIGRGKFKTGHPGRVTLDGMQELPPFTDKLVCVKQIYRERSNGGIARVKGRYELGAFFTECNCIRWASILLDLTYQFIAREIEQRGMPPFLIPDLRYTRAMVAIVQGGLSEEKAFLVEELIEDTFFKYIDNRFPTSILPSSASDKDHLTAEFLIFSQHVQWELTQAAFVSDYQGGGDLLSDPQITTNPALGNLFRRGNIGAAFTDFRLAHVCNKICHFFDLKLDIPPPSESHRTST